MANKTKTVKLRAFKIENNDPSYEISPILDFLGAKLEKSQRAEDRRIQLNKEDPNEESDLIADYDISRKDSFIFGTMIRVMASKGAPNLPNEVFNNQKIPLSQLSHLELKEKFIYKSHFYFAFDGCNLIVTLPSNRTITAFQAYINGYLKTERKEHLFEFSPLIVDIPETKASNIRSIKFRDFDVSVKKTKKDPPQPSNLRTKLMKVKEEFLKMILEDSPDFDKMMEEGIVSAELLIKFASKVPEESRKYLSALLKPIADSENIEIKTNNGSTIKGSTLQRTKDIDISTTESNMISETELFLAMESFLKELQS